MIGFTLDEIIGSVFYAICYGFIFSLVEFLLTLSYKIFTKVAYQLTEKFKKGDNTRKKTESIHKKADKLLPLKIFLFGIGFCLLSYIALDGEVRIYMLILSSASLFISKLAFLRLLKLIERLV